MLWGSVFVLTKHTRKITMDLAPEKPIIHTLPIGQFYDAGNFLITRTGPSNTGPGL